MNRIQRQLWTGRPRQQSQMVKQSGGAVNRYCQRLVGQGLSVMLGAGIGLLPAIAQAAETVRLQFGPFARTLPVSSLEAFAQDGTVDEHLEGFLRRVDDDTRQQIRTALVQPHPKDPQIFSQKLRTPMGQRLLQASGQTVRTGAGLNGAVALRSALSLAAQEPEGLSLLNVLRHFPTEVVTLDLSRALAVQRTLSRSIQETTAVTEQVELRAAAAALANPIDVRTLPDLRQRGPYEVAFVPLELQDESRDRAVPTDLFLPQIPNAAANSIPVIVFSHGLGHSRVYFRDVASHIASYGFAVAMPEHVGSNQTQLQAMESWLADEFFQRREFVNRPLDISFLLDELTRLNPSQFDNQLDPNRVGAIGHSFGGYTVLAAAGATVDFDWLQQQCAPNAEFLSNISRLLQCRALELTTSPEDVALLSQGGLRDERIQFVMVFNTVSNLFGERGMGQIQVPTLIAGGVFDYVTPIVPEQIEAFRWLTTPEKYLLLVSQKAHSTESTRLFLQFVDPLEDEREIETAQWWLRSNYTVLLVAFGEVYLEGETDYQPFLQSAYADFISVEPFLLHLVREF